MLSLVLEHLEMTVHMGLLFVLKHLESLCTFSLILKPLEMNDYVGFLSLLLKELEVNPQHVLSINSIYVSFRT